MLQHYPRGRWPRGPPLFSGSPSSERLWTNPASDPNTGRLANPWIEIAQHCRGKGPDNIPPPPDVRCDPDSAGPLPLSSPAHRLTASAPGSIGGERRPNVRGHIVRDRWRVHELASEDGKPSVDPEHGKD